MTVREVTSIIESWAPPRVAWERDNVGLQVGDNASVVRQILVSLDATPEVLSEARRKRANLLVTHHPLLFTPLRSLEGSGTTTECVRMAVQENINVYAAHTNLDFTRGGTSFALADALHLESVDILRKSHGLQRKIVTFVPPEHVDRVFTAMAGAGAGRIGNYDHCSFRAEGIGTFRGNTDANPAVGSRDTLEHVEEVRLEMIMDEWNADRVISALKASHPYEEVAFDVYPTGQASNDHGAGTIGSMRRPASLRTFLKTLKRVLHAEGIRYTGDPGMKIRRVAVCGGSGAELLDEAIRQAADVFVTADIRYHAFHEAWGRIALVDAGHYETELPVMYTLANRLTTEMKRRRSGIKVGISGTSTNPITYA
jgi:dinuclear metal center YbgI/SA1388 family protein